MQHFIMFMIVVMTSAVAVVIVIASMVMIMTSAVAIVVVPMFVIGLTVYTLYLYRGVIVHMQTSAAVIADFKRIKIAKFALAAVYAVAIV